jgi:hypothetical protein
MGKCCHKGLKYGMCAPHIHTHTVFLSTRSPRGDGFPLANMCALVSVDNKDLIPVLAAHIYTVCPTAIPTLPTPSSDASEEELMQSLGMLKGKNGEFETFERFLARTEVRTCQSMRLLYTCVQLNSSFSLLLISCRVLFRSSPI